MAMFECLSPRSISASPLIPSGSNKRCHNDAVRRRLKSGRMVGAFGAALGTTLVGCFCALSAAHAQSTRPITIIVPYSPGTGPDILARFVADGLSQQRAQPVVIDNKSGASGSIGTQIVAHSAPDGLTLLMTPDPPLTTNVFLMKKAPYDPIKDFAPVSEVA